VVLTAAHCAPPNFDASNGLVFLGDQLVAPLREHGQLIEVSDVLAHPDYDADESIHDIALIELAEPAYATPIPFLPADLGLSSTDEGATARFVGFGITEEAFEPGAQPAMESKLQFSATITSSSSHITRFPKPMVSVPVRVRQVGSMRRPSSSRCC